MAERVVLDGELHIICHVDGDATLDQHTDGDGGKVTRYNWRGYSAYEIAVQHGYTGTEEEWLASIKGETGERGPQGERGLTGETGPAGPQGEPIEITNIEYDDVNRFVRVDFSDGSTIKVLYGEQGPTGPTGPQGESIEITNVEYDDIDSVVRVEFSDGKNINIPYGEQGPTGQDGYSAYAIAVQHGYTGTEAEWLASLKGADGTQGPQGPKGEDAPGYFVVSAAPPEILVDVIMEIANPGPVWTNTAGDAYSINTQAFIFESDGVRSGEIKFARYKDTTLNAYYYTGTCDELGITVKYYYGNNYKQYTSVTFTNPPALFRLLKKTGEASGETTGGVVDLAEGYTAGESLRGPAGAAGAKGDKGDKGDAPVRGVDYWTQADQAAIVDAVLAALPAAEEVDF